MNKEILVGYHGTSRRNCKDIIKNGFEASKTKEGHWLGKGIYFYENIYYAIEWGIIRFLLGNNSYDNYKKQCSVIKGMLNCGEYEILDLNDPLGYSIYQEILKNIKKRFPNEVEKISKGKDIEIIRLLEELESKTGEDYISIFDIITADYPKDIYDKKTENIWGNFLPCIQKQICVKNSSAIEKYEEINIDDENGETYFQLITKNREEYENEKQSRIIKKTARKNKKYSR